MQVWLSIVIPVYNARRYLEDCLQSILRDCSVDIEVVLIDDGSVDGSGQMCDEYAAKHTYVTVIHQENQGVSVARNRGVAAAKGEYLIFVDADDYLSDGWRKCLEDSLCNAEGAPDILFIRKGARSSAIYATDSLPQAILRPDVLSLTMNSVCSVLYRRAFLIENAIDFIPRLTNGEDSLFNFMAVLRASSVRFSNCSFYNYRKNDHSATNRVNTQIIDTDLLFHTQLSRLLEEHGLTSPQWQETYADTLINGIYTCFYQSVGRSDSPWRARKARLAELIALPEYRKALQTTDIRRLPHIRRPLIKAVAHGRLSAAGFYIWCVKKGKGLCRRMAKQGNYSVESI